MHEMLTVVTDVRGVYLSVCLSRMTPHSEADLRLGFTVRDIRRILCQTTLATCLAYVAVVAPKETNQQE